MGAGLGVTTGCGGTDDEGTGGADLLEDVALA